MKKSKKPEQTLVIERLRDELSKARKTLMWIRIFIVLSIPILIGVNVVIFMAAK